MSLRIRQNKQPGVSSAKNFSSKSVGYPSGPRASTTKNVVPLTPVTIDESILTPLNIEIDPTIQNVRTKEKEQIKGLNNRFASYIKKVQLLEQENTILQTKWELRKNHTPTSSNTELMYKSYIANLQKQLDLAFHDKTRFETERRPLFSQVDSLKSKFEEEYLKRMDGENEFVILKKDYDLKILSKIQLEKTLESLTEEFDLYCAVYDAEIRELKNSQTDTSLVVEMDNSRRLNMDQILADVKAQYEEIAARSQEEAERWHRTKIELMTTSLDKRGAEMHFAKVEINNCNRMITRIEHEIDIVKSQKGEIEGQISEADDRGQNAVLIAMARIKQLENALADTKRAMTEQIKDYQDLMNIKLALDIEIHTYRKLMEGEENRLEQDTAVNVRPAPIRPVSSTPTKSEPNQQRRRSGPVLIKTTETKNISYS